MKPNTTMSFSSQKTGRCTKPKESYQRKTWRDRWRSEMTAISNAGVPKNRTAGDGEKVNRDNIFTGPMEVGRFKEPNGTHSWVLTRGGQRPPSRPRRPPSPGWFAHGCRGRFLRPSRLHRFVCSLWTLLTASGFYESRACLTIRDTPTDEVEVSGRHRAAPSFQDGLSVGRLPHRLQEPKSEGAGGERLYGLSPMTQSPPPVLHSYWLIPSQSKNKKSNRQRLS